jgi:PAS domain-containing protein
MNPWSFIPFSSFLINTVLAAVVFGLNPGSKTNRAYSLFAVSFAFWGFLNFIEWNGMSPRSSRLFIRIDPLSWMASTLFVLNFIYVLVQRRRDPIFRLLTAIVAAWSIIAVTTGGLFTGFRHAYWGEFAMVTRFYFSAVVMSVLLPAVWGFYILIKTFKVTRDLYFREQLKYLTIGTLAMFIVVFTDSVFRTELIGNDSLPFLGSFFLIIQSGFIFFAIVRHRFLNVDVRNAARELFSKVHEGVVILDQNQGIIDLNASAQEFFGMTKDDKPVELERIFGKGVQVRRKLQEPGDRLYPWRQQRKSGFFPNRTFLTGTGPSASWSSSMTLPRSARRKRSGRSLNTVSCNRMRPVLSRWVCLPEALPMISIICSAA